MQSGKKTATGLIVIVILVAAYLLWTDSKDHARMQKQIDNSLIAFEEIKHIVADIEWEAQKALDLKEDEDECIGNLRNTLDEIVSSCYKAEGIIIKEE